jgi:tripartite-type tricarboxylate transporter receptor subunit TctC
MKGCVLPRNGSLRHALLAVHALLAMIVAPGADAGQFPDRPVRIVVAGPAGGGTDFVARLIADKLSTQWKQTVMVDNRAGASGVIGTRFVQHALPDGYTLILGQSATHAIVPALQRPSPYDPIRDFAPVIQVSTAPDLLVVSNASPIRSFADFVASAKQKPGSVTYGTAGIGLPQHLIGYQMAQLAGVEMRHIPYKGSPPAVADLMGGQITSAVVTAAAVMPFIKSGRLRARATNSDQRLPSLPGVPTFSEVGMPSLQESGWTGLFAPAGTPHEAIVTINAAVSRVLADPDVRAKLADQFVTPMGDSPEQFASFHQGEVRRWTAIVKASGVTAE